MELTCPRKNEILQIVEKVGGPTNVSATEMDVASVAQMFPIMD